MVPMIHEINLTNFLSFGPDSSGIDLLPLNVLIGPNGSGKSNFIEAFRLLRAAPTDFSHPVKGVVGGGVSQWIWNGHESAKEASIEVTVSPKESYSNAIIHQISFKEHSRRFELNDEQIKLRERIEYEIDFASQGTPDFLYDFQRGNPILVPRDGGVRSIERSSLNPEHSILSQRRDPQNYPELFDLSEFYSGISLYAEWTFGRNAPQRVPQRADLRADFLNEKCDNLGLVLNYLRSVPESKRKLLSAVRQLYEGIDDIDVSIIANTVQVIIHEGDRVIPSTRLSDGTMRYICLLAILCHPTPPPLICIEEPELGLHPDVIPEIAKLLKEASERTQLIVTTHSEMLIDALSASPEDIVVCEKMDGSTRMRRLDAAELAEWLKKYSLGQIWRDGIVGGNRW